MSRRRDKLKNQAHPSATRLQISVPGPRALGLGCVAAVLAVTQYIPCDSISVQQGTGIALVLLWLLLACGCLLRVTWLRQANLQVTAVDLVAALLLFWLAVSALVNVPDNHGRATINTFWQWSSLILSFFVLRGLFRDPVARRGVFALMIALAVGQAAFAYYQYFVTLPQLEAQYAADPEATLREAGIVAPEGTPARKQFADRLASRQPIGAFALTNSLAAFLAPWAVALAGLLLVGRRGIAQGHGFSDSNANADRRWVICVSGLLLVIAGSLLLTKSRSALLAVLLGMLLLGLFLGPARRRFSWKWPAGLGGAALLVLGVAFAFGLLDRLVLQEAPKSFLYRVEYWQATTQLIADYPVFGAGLGNFQEHYARYKLPQASEVVADPHNFIMEIAATMGLPGLAIFLALLLAAIAASWRGWMTEQAPHQPAASPEDLAAANTWRALWGGAIAGTLLAWPIGLVVDLPPEVGGVFIGLAVLLAAAWVFRVWIEQGGLPTPLIWIGLATLLVNLLATGGISNPGIAQSLWLLLALALPASAAAAWQPTLPSWCGSLLTAVTALLLGAFLLTAYLPVMRSRTFLAEGYTQMRLGHHSLADESFLKAARADPYSFEPWQRLAMMHRQRWLTTGDDEAFVQFQKAAEQMLAKHPRSHAMWGLYGDWLLDGYRRHRQVELAEEAVEAYRQAVQRYPNSNIARARLAWAAYVAGHLEAARDEAAEALRLDALNPHGEQQLAVQKIHDPSLRGGETAAEPLMQMLRKAHNGT